MVEVVPINKHLMTPYGEAEADFMWISNSYDDSSEFHCWILETNESWWFPQQFVRAMISMSAYRRQKASEIIIPDHIFERYAPHIIRHKKSPYYKRAIEFLKRKEKQNGTT